MAVSNGITIRHTMPRSRNSTVTTDCAVKSEATSAATAPAMRSTMTSEQTLTNTSSKIWCSRLSCMAVPFFAPRSIFHQFGCEGNSIMR